MKICPQCRATYSDDLQFCKADGSDLVLVQPDIPTAINAPEPKTGLIAVAVISVLILLIGGGALLKSKQSVEVTSTPSASVAPDTGAAESPSPAPTSAPESADPLVVELAEVKRIYQESDAAYRRRDVQGHMAYLAPEWKFIDDNGKSESRASSEEYMTSRFSESSPTRLFESHLETTVQDGVRFDGDELVVPVSVVARVRDAKGKHVISVLQEDRWQKIGGVWKCIRTRVTQRL